MSAAKTFDVNAFLDARRIGRTHVSIVALLILTMMVDGYDIFLIGIILPALAAGLDIEPAAMTVVFVVQQFGLLVGNFIVGPVADRIGRRVTLLWCLLIFGSLTLVTALAETLGHLIALRFVAGIFFSGVIPNTVSLVSEIVPKKVRATCVSITFAGYTLGTTLIGAPVLAWIVPLGWQYAFVVGGVLPLALFVVLFFFLPESLRYLVNNRPGDARVPALLRRLDPSVQLDGSERFVIVEETVRAKKVPILALFQEGRWLITVLLWAGFHCAFIVSNLFGAWKNTVLSNFGGLAEERIALIMAVQGTAGIVGTLTSGLVMDRFGPTRVLPCYLGAAALAAASIAFVDLATVWVLVAFAVFGYFSNGGLSGINALASLSYPSLVRATGISWAHGLGRAGAMVGPIVGGALIAYEAGVSAVFLIAAIPQFGAALAILAMHRVLTVRKAAGAAAPAPAGV